MVHQCCLRCSVFSLQSLLPCYQLSKWRRYHLQDQSWQQVPSNHNDGSWPSHNLSQFSGEKNDVKGRLWEIGVYGGERVGPFFNISTHSLIRVANSAIKIAKLIVDHILEIGVMEEVSKSSPEPECQSSIDKVEKRVDKRCGDSDHSQPDNLPQHICTLWRNKEKFLSTMAFTIPPFTDAI